MSEVARYESMAYVPGLWSGDCAVVPLDPENN